MTMMKVGFCFLFLCIEGVEEDSSLDFEKVVALRGLWNDIEKWDGLVLRCEMGWKKLLLNLEWCQVVLLVPTILALNSSLCSGCNIESGLSCVDFKSIFNIQVVIWNLAFQRDSLSSAWLQAIQANVKQYFNETARSLSRWIPGSSTYANVTKKEQFVFFAFMLFCLWKALQKAKVTALYLTIHHCIISPKLQLIMKTPCTEKSMLVLFSSLCKDSLLIANSRLVAVLH